ncbi:hypothetical protein CLV36_108111 [Laceyella sediminis]|uniref:Uncharacterized protein n=1 Tax=Laceyella sediminis TaxID=573074 RepID=A0ABX5EPW5_9BACL|nr:hypothetical protein [Laceyella sediminis]PRZ13614.1 hypothetical protein CLV36_108111 [Laceyella sediminis]
MIENKARPQFPYYSANTDKENVIWLLQAGLPMISPSSGKVVLEMVYDDGCWEYVQGHHQSVVKVFVDESDG